MFKVDKEGKETVLYTFTWPSGAFPAGGLTRDDAGNLYGVTENGGTYGYACYAMAYSLDKRYGVALAGLQRLRSAFN